MIQYKAIILKEGKAFPAGEFDYIGDHWVEVVCDGRAFMVPNTSIIFIETEVGSHARKKT